MLKATEGAAMAGSIWRRPVWIDGDLCIVAPELGFRTWGYIRLVSNIEAVLYLKSSYHIQFNEVDHEWDNFVLVAHISKDMKIERSQRLPYFKSNILFWIHIT